MISSSGTLLTLLFGLSALATNAPRRRHALGLDGLAPPLDDELWAAEAKNAVQATARAQLTIAEAARRANHTMARFLLAGIVLEICGIACITWAVVALISSG